jgi:phosphodiesterase/alkaline phosphatase D-like protein
MIRDILIGCASFVGAMEGLALAKSLKSLNEIEATSETPKVDAFRSGVATGAIIVGSAIAWPVTAPMGVYRAYTHRDDIKAYAQNQIDHAKIRINERRLKKAEADAAKAAAAAKAASANVREIKAQVA